MRVDGDEVANTQELLEKIAILERINKALMGRVERSVDSTGTSFSHFERNIQLLEMVNERTQLLEQTNARLVAEIIERKEAEARIRRSLLEKEVLLKEVHHRVKNNLQIITSLLNLQANKVNDPRAQAVIRDSQSRIKSMALIHEKLYQSDTLSEVDFRDYIASLTSYLMSTISGNRGRITISHEIEDLRVGVDTAVPCGLILSELVTNSLKYAFPGDRTGVILVRCRMSGDGIIRLSVQDDGVGLGDASKLNSAESLGMQLVTSLAGQLGGALKADLDTGAKFTVEFPLRRNDVGRRIASKAEVADRRIRTAFTETGHLT